MSTVAPLIPREMSLQNAGSYILVFAFPVRSSLPRLRAQQTRIEEKGCASQSSISRIE